MGLIKKVSIYSLAIFLGFYAASLVFGASTEPAHPDEVVVLIHGILNKPVFMKPLEKSFIKEGYSVINWGYPSTEHTIQDHAAQLDITLKKIDTHKKIHIVAFSLGSILSRYYLKHYPLPNMGRLVMIGPPNHGSEMVDKLYPYKWFHWIYGDKSIEQLQASQSDYLNKECGVPSCEFGIIAGGKSDSEGFSSMLEGDDDGTVRVESAKLEGSKDFIILPYQHTTLLFSKYTFDNALHFLTDGTFIHVKEGS